MCSQIVECRRVLKWTYAYGYYLPEREHAKRQFFEYLQGLSFHSNFEIVWISFNQFSSHDGLNGGDVDPFIIQVRLSLGWNDSTNVQKRSCMLT